MGKVSSCLSRLVPRPGGWRCGVMVSEPADSILFAQSGLGTSKCHCTSVPFFPGQVPEYLVSRQEEWERDAERRKAEAPDPSCPPGMKLMPEEDRLQTLKQLQVRGAEKSAPPLSFFIQSCRFIDRQAGRSVVGQLTFDVDESWMRAARVPVRVIRPRTACRLFSSPPSLVAPGMPC